jgi:hypothetical protein
VPPFGGGAFVGVEIQSAATYPSFGSFENRKLASPPTIVDPAGAVYVHVAAAPAGCAHRFEM